MRTQKRKGVSRNGKIIKREIHETEKKIFGC